MVAVLIVVSAVGRFSQPRRLVPQAPESAVAAVDCTRPLAGQVLVVDPGHGKSPLGGGYTGDHGVNGAWEDVNVLDIGQRLVPLLQAAGATADITRGQTDPGRPPILGLIRRVRFTAAHHATLFVSIHQNNASKGHPAEHGVETFWFRPDSKGYAETMQRVLVAETGLADHGVARQPFYVLRNSPVPAVLIEGGFLSNPVEAALISTAEFHQKEAVAIRDGLVAYVAPRCKIPWTAPSSVSSGAAPTG